MPLPLHNMLTLRYSTTSLSDGIPVLVVPNATTDVVRMDLVADGGKYSRPNPLHALLATRMLREGTPQHSARDIADTLDWHGAWLELSVSHFHSYVTLYALGRCFASTCRLVSELVATPTFPEERLRTVVENNRRQFLVARQKGNVIALRHLTTALYGPDHPLARAVDESDYDAVTRQQLADTWQALFSHPSRLSIVLSGNVTPDVLSTVESCFGTLPQDPYAPRVPNADTRTILSTPCHPADGATFEQPLRVSRGRAQASISIGRLVMPVDDDDYPAFRLLNTVLGGYFGSRLMQSVREEGGYTYGISSDLAPGNMHTTFTISCECRSDSVDAVLDEVRRQLQRLIDEPVGDDELQRVRNYSLGELCRTYEGIFAKADALVYLRNYGLPDTHLDRCFDAVRTTTPQQLQALAARYLRPDAMKVVVVE